VEELDGAVGGLRRERGDLLGALGERDSELGALRGELDASRADLDALQHKLEQVRRRTGRLGAAASGAAGSSARQAWGPPAARQRCETQPLAAQPTAPSHHHHHHHHHPQEAHAHALSRSAALGVQQSLEAQLEAQRRAYDRLKVEAGLRDREQQGHIHELHIQLVTEQEAKVGGRLARGQPLLAPRPAAPWGMGMGRAAAAALPGQRRRPSTCSRRCRRRRACWRASCAPS
jgi:hypothetical protein